MSRVGLIPLLDRDPRGWDGVSLLYDAFSGLTIDAENFAEEGIDRRAIDANAHVEEGFTPISESTRASLAAAAAWTTYAPNATSFRTGALTVGSNELLWLRLFVFLQSTKSSGVGLAASSDLEFRLANSAGGGTKLDGSYRRKKCLSAAGYHGWVSVEGWVVGPVSLSWVEVQYKLTGTAYPAKSLFDGVLYRRV